MTPTDLVVDGMAAKPLYLLTFFTIVESRTRAVIWRRSHDTLGFMEGEVTSRHAMLYGLFTLHGNRTGARTGNVI